jgi:hypothetical protein
MNTTRKGNSLYLANGTEVRRFVKGATLYRYSTYIVIGFNKKAPTALRYMGPVNVHSTDFDIAAARCAELLEEYR